MTTRTAAALLAALMAASFPAAVPAADGEPAQQMIEPLTLAAYIQKAAVADMFELRSSKIALDKAQRPQVKDFAQRMLRDHNQTTRMLEKAASSDVVPADTKIALPKQLDPKHEKLIEKLQGASPDEFDRRYLDMQVAAHQDALRLHRSYAEAGEVEPVRKMARQIAEIIEMHLEEVQRLTSARAPETTKR